MDRLAALFFAGDPCANTYTMDAHGLVAKTFTDAKVNPFASSVARLLSEEKESPLNMIGLEQVTWHIRCAHVSSVYPRRIPLSDAARAYDACHQTAFWR